MAEWRRICCAIDFSKASRAALHEAAALARRLGAELTLAHIHERPPLSTRDILSAARLLEPAAEQLHDKLDAWRSDAERIVKRPVRVALFSGSPAAELVRFARANGLDAIVLGTHGRTGLSRVILGSVADHVIRGAHCPVIVVRADMGARCEVATQAAG